MHLIPLDVLVLLGGLAKGENSFHANNELSLDITPISSPEENAVPEQTVKYELVGAAFYDAQHYVSTWRDDISGEARWFFHDGMAPLKNGIGCKDMRSIRSNQSS